MAIVRIAAGLGGKKNTPSSGRKRVAVTDFAVIFRHYLSAIV